mmetsp:Transcript_34833/g.87618  ORF Transcript_34833/g.87618 Transcript_34833/m.87618 type:complete len:350 (-) Transcript_34833:917-1966(-)
MRRQEREGHGGPRARRHALSVECHLDGEVGAARQDGAEVALPLRQVAQVLHGRAVRPLLGALGRQHVGRVQGRVGERHVRQLVAPLRGQEQVVDLGREVHAAVAHVDVLGEVVQPHVPKRLRLARPRALRHVELELLDVHAARQVYLPHLRDGGARRRVGPRAAGGIKVVEVVVRVDGQHGHVVAARLPRARHVRHGVPEQALAGHRDVAAQPAAARMRAAEHVLARLGQAHRLRAHAARHAHDVGRLVGVGAGCAEELAGGQHVLRKLQTVRHHAALVNQVAVGPAAIAGKVVEEDRCGGGVRQHNAYTLGSGVSVDGRQQVRVVCPVSEVTAHDDSCKLPQDHQVIE